MQRKAEGKKFDEGKPMFRLFPKYVLREIAKVLTYGSKKYDEDPNDPNWMKIPDAKNRYYDAAMRHLDAYHNGEEYDEESNYLHIVHAITNLMFILGLKLNDDIATDAVTDAQIMKILSTKVGEDNANI